MENSRDGTFPTFIAAKTECELSGKTCRSNSACVTIEGSYICECNRGFQDAKDNSTDCVGKGFSTEY